ncbi:hypothetical protein [Streptomyces sp. B6B3]|uniref:hypothetical protein n=1 Tax=Streptomyces sp. B6B3 TaxID=3153570 RepID=UPI00325F100C
MSDGGAGGGAAEAPTAPFRQRVRVLIEVVDDDDELALARAVLQQRGWPVREPSPDEAPELPGGTRRPLVVEIRLNGARWRAERAAKGVVETLADRYKLALWVRDAALLTLPPEDRTTYHVIRRGGGGPFHRLWARLGGRDTHRLVRLPTSLTREAVERELHERHLGGHRFSATDHDLLPAPPDTEEEAARRARDPVSPPEVLRFTAALLGALASGYALRHVSGPLLAVPVAILLLSAAVFTTLPWREPLRPVGRIGVGAAFAGGLALLGWLLADSGQELGPDGRTFSWLLGGLLLFGLPGTYLALRQTWFSRNAGWLLPVAIPVAGSMVAWLGRLMRAVYLDAFGIPSGSVHSAEGLWDYAAAARSLAVAFGFVLFFVGVLGWARHAYLALGGNRLFAVLSTLILSLVFALTAVLLGIYEADTTARDAMAEARGGDNPASYFGLQGRLTCVLPVADTAIPVENGPVPTGHPVLSFGSSEDWIWLWDPERDSAPTTFAVRREDVRLLTPDDAGCPAS